MTTTLSPLDGQDIIDGASEIIDETIDSDLALTIINHFKNLIEADRNWYFLIKEDATKTRLPSDTFLTEKSLPDDFLMADSVVLGDGTDYSDPIDEVSYQQRRRFSDLVKYYINWASGKFGICGTFDKTQTIYLYYVYQTPDLTLATSPVWPAKFHRILVFLLAAFYKKEVDFDDISAGQAVASDQQASSLFQSLVQLDAQIKARQLNFNTSMQGNGTDFRSGHVNIND
jgi:hypothetical protein